LDADIIKRLSRQQPTIKN